MGDDQEKKIERRVDMAVQLSVMSGKIDNVCKDTLICKKDRGALFKRMRQMDVQITKLETKQSVVTWVGGSVVLITLGTLAKGAYSYLTKNSHPH